MTKQKSTKRALLMSGLALLMCVSMLIGSTFAWFTDSVTSGRNKIVAGNLDVVLEYKTDWDNEWVPVDENTKIFKEGALYEPGYTEVVYLRVSNAGSLALKYNLMVNILDEKASTNVNGEEFKLSDYLQIGTYLQDEYSSGANYADVLIPFMFGTRDAAVSSTTMSKISEANSLVVKDAPLKAGEQTAQVMAVVLTMPTTVGNEANYDSKVAAAPEIDLSISLVATQLNSESDSFGSDYDLNATYPVLAAAAADLRDAMKTDGANIVLANDITVTADDTTGYGQHMFLANGKDVTIDLNGKDIVLSEDASQVGSLFSSANGGSITIKGDGNITIKNGKAFVCWTMNDTDQVNVYGGNYSGNGHEGNNALFYVQAGKIDIYGGRFTYPVADNDNWGFNARDALGNKLVIVIHEGVLLQHEQFQYGDNSRIQLAEGCTIEEVVIDGETWYQVVKA